MCDPDWIGRRVVAHTGERGGHGGYVERAVVAADAIVAVPDGLDLQVAAAVLHDGATALGLVDNARIRPREWVLVLAAGGGLGILLVQLVHAAGGRVLAAARGRRKLGIVRTLGADVIVDYSEPGLARESAARPQEGRAPTWCSTAPAGSSAAPRSRSRRAAAASPRTADRAAGSL